MVCDQLGHQGVDGARAIVPGMVTRPRKAQRRRLFLKEHREAKGVSAATMAAKLGIERESVYRLERELWRVNSDKQADWAHALGIEPEALWRPPGAISLDAMVAAAPDELREMAADIVRRLVSKG
jgi:transcriptional regulator with XRE-family HTH domain